jgi:UDP-2,3-diacylglucosamine pyrophosphatase LpxH
MPQNLSTILSCWTKAPAERFFRLHPGSDAGAVSDLVERSKIACYVCGHRHRRASG